jgi:hypothetical protein
MQEFKKAYSDCTEFLEGHPDMAADEYWLKMKNPIEAILNKDSDVSNPDEAIDEEADPEESKIDTLFAEYLKQETADMAQEIEGVYNVNKGYASFRRIERVKSNGEYILIRDDSVGGPRLNDHIGLVGNLFEENKIIY